MASATLAPVTGWTVGETISVYERDSRNVAVGSAVTTAAVGADSTTTFSGLTAETKYIATDGTHEVRFGTHTDPLDSAQSGSDETVNTVAATGAAETIPAPTTATVNHLTLDANCTLTFPTAAAGRSFSLVLKQDATGSRTVTWPGTVQWPGGVAPTLTTTAAKRDALTFLCVDGTNWLGFVAGQNF